MCLFVELLSVGSQIGTFMLMARVGWHICFLLVGHFFLSFFHFFLFSFFKYSGVQSMYVKSEKNKNKKTSAPPPFTEQHFHGSLVFSVKPTH